MVKDMRQVIRGVVKDHRLPHDYTFHYTQPFHTKTFITALKRFLVTRHISKQNVTIPIYGLFGFVFPFFIGYNLFHYMTRGRLSSTLQPQVWLYRKGHYGDQQSANQNPDNFFDRNMNCWTTDPFCGVDVGPKRPWEDLKEPEKNLFKLRRNASEGIYQDRSAFR